MNNFAGYIRVSTIGQKEDGVSLDMQASKIRSYVELQGGHLVNIFRDEGVSGTKESRAGLGLLLESIEERKTEHLVVYSLSRLSRRTLHLLTLIETFNKHNIKFHSITESINTASPQGAFFLTIISALSQLERDTIASRTRQALEYKKSNGEKCGGSLPYGFAGVDSEGKLVEDLAEKQVAQEILYLRKQGLSLREICSKMEERGYSPKGGSWHPQKVSNIISYYACQSSNNG